MLITNHLNYFNEHLQSYNVTLTNNLMCCCIENLNSVHPTVCVKSNDLYYIPLNKIPTYIYLFFVINYYIINKSNLFLNLSVL